MSLTKITADQLRFSFVDNEVPAGVIDGEDATFSLAHTPEPGSLRLYRDGLRQVEGRQFTVTAKTIEFDASHLPSAASSLVADYRPEDDLGG